MKKYLTIGLLILFFAAKGLVANDFQRIAVKDYTINRDPIYGVAMNPINNKFYALGELTDSNNKCFLFISEDSGKTWSPKNKLPDYFYRIYIDSKGNIYLNNFYGLTLTKDEGYTNNVVFCAPKISNDYDNRIMDCKFNSKDEIILTVDAFCNYCKYYDTLPTIIYTSKNYGQSWDTINSNIQIGKYIIDSNDDIYTVSKPNRLYSIKEFEGDYYESLTSAKNAFYKYNQVLKQFDLIVQSNKDSTDGGVFESISENNNTIFLLYDKESSSSSIYYPFFVYDEKLITYNKKSNIFDSIIIDNNYNYDYDNFDSRKKIDMIFNDNNQILLFTGKNIYKSNNTFEKFNLVQRCSDNCYNTKFYKLLPQKIIFTGDQGDLFSSDDGSTWLMFYSYLNHLPYKNAYITKDSVFVCLDTNNRLFSTLNKGFTWNDLTGNIKPTQKITSICQTNNGNYVVGTENEGVLYRRNDGYWEKRNNKLLSLNINNLREGKSGELYVCTNDGFYSTHDECQT